MQEVEDVRSSYLLLRYCLISFLRSLELTLKYRDEKKTFCFLFIHKNTPYTTLIFSFTKLYIRKLISIQGSVIIIFNRSWSSAKLWSEKSLRGGPNFGGKRQPQKRSGLLNYDFRADQTNPEKEKFGKFYFSIFFIKELLNM